MSGTPFLCAGNWVSEPMSSVLPGVHYPSARVRGSLSVIPAVGRGGNELGEWPSPRMALKAVADSARFPGFQKYRMSIMCRRGDPDVNKPPSLALKNLQPCENVCHSCNKNALKDARCCQAHRDLAWPPRQPQPDLPISS